MKFNWYLQLMLFALQLTSVSAFDQYLLRKCNTAGFCRRNRHYAQNIQQNNRSDDLKAYYVIDESSIQYDKNDYSLHASIIKEIPNNGDSIKVELPFHLQLLQDGNAARFTIDETRSHKNYIPQILNQRRYNETSKWAFASEKILSKVPISKTNGNNSIKISPNSSHADLKIEIFTKSFLINVYWKNQLTITVNERSFLNYEHLRSKNDNKENLLPEELDFDMFHDSFNYSRSDTMPFGPESVALDFTFNEFGHLYGLPEHPDSFRLQDTSKGEPYRLFAADVARYDVGTRMPMYGNIPFVIGNNPRAAAGVFWVNAAETWVDFRYPNHHQAQSHWMSETGIIDVVMFFGDNPMQIVDEYTNLTGRPVLPKEAAIGHHQSRWNYYNESDVLTVDSNMASGQFPYDIIWLDLDYTDENKFFTWKPDAFPNPSRLLKKLGDLGRELVVLIDPHLKKNYSISNTAVEKDVVIKNEKGNTFYGTCWPGISVWIDTFSDLGTKVWGNFYKNFVNDTRNLGIWNDMDEPSIFNGIETTAPKDLIHAGGFEHRALHNAYSLTVHQATFEGLSNIFNESSRPFVLTRSHFSGSQRTAATWTGDNAASWNYLQISIPMVLSSNAAGMPFIGSDIAGFLDNPEDELIVRWYQAGLWYPFFRAHAQNETRRREPFLFKDPIKSYVRDAIQLRYHLLPTFYTAFYKSSLSGSPIMKPMIFEKPQYTDFAAVDDQFYIGYSGILVKPILTKNSSSTNIKVTDGVYYDFHNLRPQKPSKSNRSSEIKSIHIEAGLEKIPILLEGGHIITKRDGYQKSSIYYRNEPYSLVIAPDAFGNAKGELYADDGETLAHKKGQFLHSFFKFKNFGIISGNTSNVPSNHEIAGNTLIGKIVIATANNGSKINDTASVNRGGHTHTVNVNRTSPYQAIIMNPMVYANESWTIEL